MRGDANILDSVPGITLIGETYLQQQLGVVFLYPASADTFVSSSGQVTQERSVVWLIPILQSVH